MLLQISSTLWCQPGSCRPTHPLASAPAHGGMCLGSLSDGAHHELDQRALLTVRHRWGENRASPGDIMGTAGGHKVTGDTQQQGTHSDRGSHTQRQGTHSSTQHHTLGTLAHLSRLSCLFFLICHLHHLKVDMAEVKEAHRNVGWRKGSMEGNTRKIYKIRENQ